MRLLLTRAAEDSARTREKLEAAGHEVLVSPVIEIVGTGATWPTGVVDALLATSGQAFEVLDDRLGITPEARRLMPLHLVGEHTAEVARKRGFLGAATVAPNVMTLTMRFKQLAHRPKRLVYLAGRDRKPDLEVTLEAIDQTVETVVTYEARNATHIDDEAAEAMHDGTLDGVLHFSRRSASLFRDIARAEALDIMPLTHFCLSDDAATPLVEARCPDIKIAEAPNKTALLALLDVQRIDASGAA